MPKWNINRNGPNWLMNAKGQVIGYRDREGGEYQLPQLPGIWGVSEGFDDPTQQFLSEVTEYVTLTASGIASAVPCEFAGFICSVAAGTITIYDALSATGTPIVPATALSVGSFPILGAGTNGKTRFKVGCYIVLSGAATVRALVG